MGCNHTKTVSRAVREYDWDLGEEVSHIVNEQVSTCEDVDIHRYKCTQCGKMFYYSSAAKDFYERGIRRGIFVSL